MLGNCELLFCFLSFPHGILLVLACNLFRKSETNKSDSQFTRTSPIPVEFKYSYAKSCDSTKQLGITLLILQDPISYLICKKDIKRDPSEDRRETTNLQSLLLNFLH
jgi:hypothetical protein